MTGSGISSCHRFQFVQLVPVLIVIVMQNLI